MVLVRAAPQCTGSTNLVAEYVRGAGSEGSERTVGASASVVVSVVVVVVTALVGLYSIVVIVSRSGVARVVGSISLSKWSSRVGTLRCAMCAYLPVRSVATTDSRRGEVLATLRLVTLCWE